MNVECFRRRAGVGCCYYLELCRRGEGGGEGGEGMVVTGEAGKQGGGRGRESLQGELGRESRWGWGWGWEGSR